MRENADRQLLDVLWAFVLMQGAITLVSALEAVVGGFSLGSIFVVGPVIVLTFGGAVLALVAARGLRLGRLWARRVTVIAEFLLLAQGTLSIVISMVMTQALVGLTTLLTAVAIPFAVLFILVRNAELFERGVT